MTAFVDTNVLVYAFDASDAQKQARAVELIESGPQFVVSAQVLGEFFVTVTRKLATPLDHATAAAAVERLSRLPVVPVDARLVAAAVQTSHAKVLSYWDSLIVEAAVTAGCDRILTEDLSHGAVLRGVTIENPFL